MKKPNLGLQSFPDLANWTNVPVGEILMNTDGPAGTLRYTLDGGVPRFVRLKVTPTP